MKKCLVLSVMIAILCAMAVTVSAGPSIPNGIQGRYAATGIVNCLVAPAGFSDKFTPNGPPGLWLTSTGTQEGVYTFNKDGTGAYTGVQRMNTLPGPAVQAPPSASEGNESCAFTYTVANDGTITFSAVPNTHKIEYVNGPNAGHTSYVDLMPVHGWISKDGNTIHITCGAPPLLNALDEQGKPTGVQISCEPSLVLTKMR